MCWFGLQLTSERTQAHVFLFDAMPQHFGPTYAKERWQRNALLSLEPDWNVFSASPRVVGTDF